MLDRPAGWVLQVVWPCRRSSLEGGQPRRALQAASVRGCPTAWHQPTPTPASLFVCLCVPAHSAVRSVRAYVRSYLADRLAEARQELQLYADRYRACMQEALDVARCGELLEQGVRCLRPSADDC